MKAHDLNQHIGIKYNRITVTGEAPRTKKDREWSYVCECGNTGVTRPGHIINGLVKSCGCLHSEVSRENGKKSTSLLGNTYNKTHGMCGTRPYRIWVGMKTRCNNSEVREYPDYGGRGITYDPKWETFEGFWEDMAEGYSDELTIDRNDTNGNYEKSNCSWECMSVQGHHRRKRKGSQSTYVGVKKRDGKFEACFCKNGDVQYLGYFNTEHEAAQAYDDAYEIVYGIRNNKTEMKDSNDSN